MVPYGLVIFGPFFVLCLKESVGSLFLLGTGLCGTRLLWMKGLDTLLCKDNSAGHLISPKKSLCLVYLF